MTSTPGARDVGLHLQRERRRACRREVRRSRCADVTAATVIADRGVGGRRHGAVAELVEVVAGRDHRHDAGGSRALDRLHDEIARRLDLRLAEREVDHVHAVGDGRLDRSSDLGAVAVEPEAGGRDGQGLVVAEVRVRRDAGEQGGPAPARRARRRRSRRHASRGTNWSGRTALAAYFHVGDGGVNVRCTITFGVASCVWPFGNPGGYWKPLGLKYGMVGLDTVVDDPDLHPVAGRLEVRAPELVGADLLRAELHRERVVANVRPDLRDARNVCELRDLRAREDDGEAVRDEPVAPADP